MIFDVLASVALFALLSFGGGWSVAAHLRCSAGERLLAAVALSVISVYLFAWTVYVFSLSWSLLWILPAIAAALLGARCRSLRTAWQDEEMRELVTSQGIVTSWCIGWLALVITYSGGSWVGDWFGHWQRSVHFLEREPTDILFNGFDPLTSRPPFANIVTGAFMALTRIDFAHYQLAMTFLASLAFLPAALLARHFGGRSTTALVAVFFMLNPLFVQNATFAWTKLPAAFFTLAAGYFFLRARNADFPAAGLLCSLALGAAILTHYSAGPYAVLIAGASIVRAWSRRNESSWWRETSLALGAGIALLATWFAWSLSTFGAKGTFLTNTSVTDTARSVRDQLTVAVLNVRDTLVPHFLREMDDSLFAQTSSWGWWRDWFFQSYQVNLLFAFGSITWLVLVASVLKDSLRATPRVRLGWTLAVGSVIVLGIVVHSGRDRWGLAHICLQPLILLGLAYLAARWSSLRIVWRWAIVAGATADLLLGIVLQFGAQSFLLDRWLAPTRPAAETVFSYSAHAAANLRAKLHSGWKFLGDRFDSHTPIILALLGSLLLLALLRIKTSATPAPCSIDVTASLKRSHHG